MEYLALLKGTFGIVAIILVVCGGVGLKLWSWWKNKHIEGLEHTVERQDNAIEVYEKKDEVTQHDQKVDQQTDATISTVEGKMGHGEDSDAQAVSEGLDDFFNKK
jgi:hypothetical protein